MSAKDKNQKFSSILKKSKVNFLPEAVVCLRGGEWGACLGPSFLGTPRGVSCANFPHFWWKTYYPLIYYFPMHIIMYSVLPSKRPQQQLYCASTLFSKGSPTATAMCRYSGFKRAPNSSYNAQVPLSKWPLTATVNV